MLPRFAAKMPKSSKTKAIWRSGVACCQVALGPANRDFRERRGRLPMATLWTATLAYICLSASGAMANEPCSGRKGCISNCQGDSSSVTTALSASKGSCVTYMGGIGLLGGSAEMRPRTDGICSCREGQCCAGPKGGRFCIKDNGRKSCLRK